MDHTQPRLIDSQHLLTHLRSIARPELHLLRSRVAIAYQGYSTTVDEQYLFGTQAYGAHGLSSIVYGSITSNNVVTEPWMAAERITLRVTRDIPLMQGTSLPRCRIDIGITGCDGVVHPPHRTQHARLFSRAHLEDLVPTEMFLGRLVRPVVPCGYIGSHEETVITA